MVIVGYAQGWGKESFCFFFGDGDGGFILIRYFFLRDISFISWLRPIFCIGFFTSSSNGYPGVIQSFLNVSECLSFCSWHDRSLPLRQLLLWSFVIFCWGWRCYWFFFNLGFAIGERRLFHWFREDRAHRLLNLSLWSGGLLLLFLHSIILVH